ncbi:MAG: peptide-methionine (R)-S-oxide reductase MsrB [Ignavibacteria bacterium]|nr:peptide-methionine (R)-S-oxide reductase MsrB [Ignavibacteria bacterium]
MKITYLFIALLLLVHTTASAQTIKIFSVEKNKYIAVNKIILTEKQWKKQLPAKVFAVARKHGTERAFSGKYHDNHDNGIYKCVCCETELFNSDHKFDSGTGWPSFWQPINATNIGSSNDSTLGMKRTEVTCARCDAHLGHVFDDGPQPTGLRYCINSVCLTFVKR